VVVVSGGKAGYRELRRGLREAPPGMKPFPYPLRTWADRVLRMLPKAFTGKRNEKSRDKSWALASYLINWALQS
jgi:hypothetical protein